MEFYSAFLYGKKIIIYAKIWVDLENIKWSEMNQSQKTNAIQFHLHEVLWVVKIIETQSTIVVTMSLLVEWNKGLLFNRYRALVLQDAKTSGGIGDGCTEMGTYHETVYFKWLRW